MGIIRINEFPEGSGSLSNDDVFLFMDDPTGDGVTKKISLSELSSFINEGSEASTNISTCLLHEYADPNGFSTPTSVAIDGMSYGGGQVVVDSAFGPNSSRVTLYSDSMFAMVAVNADIDTVYYNGETGSDGDGEKSVSAGVSNYRGYYSYHNLISGDDPTIQQIVISKSSTMSGSNRSVDTNNDDFTVDGLSGSDVVIVLNIYWNNIDGPEFSDSTTVAIQQFIDLVMFDEATPRTNINNIRTAFYDNSTTIKTAIQNANGDDLYDGFEFYRSFQKVTPSGGSGSGAVLEIEVEEDDGSYDDQDVLVPGTGYQVGDTLTVSGNLLGGTTPTNDVTITVDSINDNGGIVNYSAVGTAITNLWPNSYIIDGNDDQYDIGNFIGTNRTRSTALVTLAYDPIEEDGESGDDVFPILTILSSDKTISEGQWVWFEEGNAGAFINYTLPNVTTVDRLVNGEYQVVLIGDGSLIFPDNSRQSTAWTGSVDYNNINNIPAILPADASGYLVNDGSGILSWTAGDGTFSGNYNDLTNKPTYTETGHVGGMGYGGEYAQADSLVLAGLNPSNPLESYGGDLILTGGYGGMYGDLFGEVRIKGNTGFWGSSGLNFEWRFTSDKKIKLPEGGDVVDSTGTSVLGIPSSTGLVPNSTSITNIVSISQANYDALGTKDPSTLYVIQ